MIVEFTQFLRPDGRKRTIHFELADKSLDESVNRLLKEGFRFEIEVLQTGEVSMEILREDEDDEVDSIAMEVIKNKPGGIVPFIEKMIRDGIAELDHREG